MPLVVNRRNVALRAPCPPNLEAVDKQHELGQFLSPRPVAELLASFVEFGGGDVRMLEAGAGSGALIAAVVQRACDAAHRPHNFYVDALELDEALIPALRRTLDACALRCDAVGMNFKADVHCGDFIEWAVERVRGDWFANGSAAYTLALLNPPYRKIRSDSRERLLLRSAGIETSNLYTGFLSLAARLLEPGGQLVAITPRSFCNGPYFRLFRTDLLERLTLGRIHVFDSRSAAFRGDAVLQENVIISAVRESARHGSVMISSSSGKDGATIRERAVPYAEVIRPGDAEHFIRLPSDDRFADAADTMTRFHATLPDLGLGVSTGRVVDFRARDFLRDSPGPETAPLIYPCHFNGGWVRWPRLDARKPNAVVCCDETNGLLVPEGVYVLVKRFTAKEERRRVVACIWDSARVCPGPVGFENHLNYFHVRGTGLDFSFARGLAAFLNSTLLDHSFRLFSGHTQVNATDLRSLRYPSREALLQLGERIDPGSSQAEIDAAVNEIAIA